MGDFDALLADLGGDTRNVILTLARIWSTVARGDIRSKDAAADWALDRLPGEHRPVLARARAIYLGHEEERWDDLRPRGPAVRRPRRRRDRADPDPFDFVKACRNPSAGRQLVRPVRLRLVLTTAVAAAVLAPAPSAHAAAAPDPEIAGLQVALRSKGLYFGRIDGVAGPMTAKRCAPSSGS